MPGRFNLFDYKGATVIADYGADSLRLYEMFMGPLEAMKPWSTRGVEGITRFPSGHWAEVDLDETLQRLVGLGYEFREFIVETNLWMTTLNSPSNGHKSGLVSELAFGFRITFNNWQIWSVGARLPARTASCRWKSLPVHKRTTPFCKKACNAILAISGSALTR